MQSQCFDLQLNNQQNNDMKIHLEQTNLELFYLIYNKILTKEIPIPKKLELGPTNQHFHWSVNKSNRWVNFR